MGYRNIGFVVLIALVTCGCSSAPEEEVVVVQKESALAKALRQIDERKERERIENVRRKEQEQIENARRKEQERIAREKEQEQMRIRIQNEEREAKQRKALRDEAERVRIENEKKVSQEKRKAELINEFKVQFERSSLIIGVEPIEDRLYIIVDDAWHSRPYQQRLMATQNMWKKWKEIVPDAYHFGLGDRNGNYVGGTGLGGIWVSKN